MIPTPAIAASMAASAVFTTNREWIGIDASDLAVVKTQAFGDENLSFPKIPSGLDSHRKAESSHH